MIQTVYVLEMVRAEGVIRVHYAQTPGAAQRAAGRFHLAGRWEPGESGGPVASRLLNAEGRELARVVREALEYT